MYRYFFIAKNNIKKQKGDMITFLVMTFLASFMIFTCLNLLTGTNRVLDTNKEKINGADIVFMKSDEEVSDFKVEEIMEGNDYLANLDVEKYLNLYGKYRKKGNENWNSYVFYLHSYDEERITQTMSMDASSFSGNEIVLPISLSPTFSIGDTMELKIGDNVYELKVAGYNEDFLICSPMNFSVYNSFVSDEMYEQILFENPNFVESSKFFKAQLSNKAVKKHKSDQEVSDEIYNEFNDWYHSYKNTHPEMDLSFNLNIIPAGMMKVTNMILPYIFISIILVFGLIILVIALVVIDFSIKNFILNNMKNTGIMEASGYTVREMISILLVQLLTISGIGSILGVALGALLQGKIGFIILYLLGLSWNQTPDIAVAIGVVIGICAVILVFTLIIGREYKKTTVLEALRGGINNHNFRKNYFPFDKTSFSIHVTIALKETFGKFKSQIGVIIIMAILAFSAAMGFGMYENLGKDVDALLRISGLDMPSAIVTGDESMEATVKSFECVDFTYRDIYVGTDFSFGNKNKNITTRIISDTSVMREDMIVEGRWPKHENEVALGTKLASDMNASIGDVVTVKNGEEKNTYIVTGYLQTFNNMGMMGYMTMDGYERIGGTSNISSINIILKKGYTFEDIKKEFNDVYPDVEIEDVVASTGGLMTMLKVSMRIILAIIMIVTSFIVALAEALLVRTKISKEWRNLGVSKALGFSSNELILQIILSNIPSILIGIVLGLVTVAFFGDKVMLIMFAIFGFRKIRFVLSPIAYISVFVVITGVAVLVSYINGKRIKKLEPVKMITEE